MPANVTLNISFLKFHSHVYRRNACI